MADHHCTSMSRSEYELLLMELVRHWKSECRGIPIRGSIEWRTWIDNLHSMARLSNVPLDWMQTEELLKQKLSQADYTDGFTAYARSQQKSSLKRQGAYIVLKGPSQRGTNNVYA